LIFLQFFAILSLIGDDFGCRWGTSQSGPTTAGRYPAITFLGGYMKKLCVFIDESGDFGPYDQLSPYYIVTLVFHDKSIDISNDIARLNEKLQLSGFEINPIHAGPLIRREREYKNYTLLERKRILNLLYNFTRTIDISYISLVVNKKQLVNDIDLTLQLSKQFSAFCNEHMEHFMTYDLITVYYDYGQRELSLSIVTLFSALMNNVEFKKGTQADYKLFQAADLLCTMELLALKSERKTLSKSELLFFKSAKDLNKSYLKAIHKKRFHFPC